MFGYVDMELCREKERILKIEKFEKFGPPNFIYGRRSSSIDIFSGILRDSTVQPKNAKSCTQVEADGSWEKHGHVYGCSS